MVAIAFQKWVKLDNPLVIVNNTLYALGETLGKKDSGMKADSTEKVF